jgi:hypothetical protein
MATIGSAGVTRTTDYDGLGTDYTNYSSNNTTNNYIPVLFAKNMLRNFYETSSYPLISNTEYQGQIKNVGDSVIIRKAPTLNIGNYEVGGSITYQIPTSTAVELNIDTAKYWAFRLDDIDELQSDLGLMKEFSAAASKDLEKAIDTDCLSTWVAGAATYNKGATAGQISRNINLGTSGAGNGVAITGGESGNAVDFIMSCNQVLDEENIPSEGRWIVLPSWYITMLKTGVLRRADTTGDSSGVIRTGVVGMIDKFMVLRNNNLPWDGTNKNSSILFGTKEALTFAMQLTKTDTLQIQNSFGTYVRGLAVYGKAVVQPSALGVGIVHYGAN